MAIKETNHNWGLSFIIKLRAKETKRDKMLPKTPKSSSSSRPKKSSPPRWPCEGSFTFRRKTSWQKSWSRKSTRLPRFFPANRPKSSKPVGEDSKWVNVMIRWEIEVLISVSSNEKWRVWHFCAQLTLVVPLRATRSYSCLALLVLLVSWSKVNSPHGSIQCQLYEPMAKSRSFRAPNHHSIIHT